MANFTNYYAYFVGREKKSSNIAFLCTKLLFFQKRVHIFATSAKGFIVMTRLFIAHMSLRHPLFGAVAIPMEGDIICARR